MPESIVVANRRLRDRQARGRGGGQVGSRLSDAESTSCPRSSTGGASARERAQREFFDAVEGDRDAVEAMLAAALRRSARRTCWCNLTWLGGNPADALVEVAAAVGRRTDRRRQPRHAWRQACARERPNTVSDKARCNVLIVSTSRARADRAKPGPGRREGRCFDAGGRALRPDGGVGCTCRRFVGSDGRLQEGKCRMPMSVPFPMRSAVCARRFAGTPTDERRRTPVPAEVTRACFVASLVVVASALPAGAQSRSAGTPFCAPTATVHAPVPAPTGEAVGDTAKEAAGGRSRSRRPTRCREWRSHTARRTPCWRTPYIEQKVTTPESVGVAISTKIPAGGFSRSPGNCRPEALPARVARSWCTAGEDAGSEQAWWLLPRPRTTPGRRPGAAISGRTFPGGRLAHRRPGHSDADPGRAPR